MDNKTLFFLGYSLLLLLIVLFSRIYILYI